MARPELICLYGDRITEEIPELEDLRFIIERHPELVQDPELMGWIGTAVTAVTSASKIFGKVGKGIKARKKRKAKAKAAAKLAAIRAKAILKTKAKYPGGHVFRKTLIAVAGKALKRYGKKAVRKGLNWKERRKYRKLKKERVGIVKAEQVMITKQKKEKTKNMMLMVGVPVAASLAFMLLQKKR